MPGRAPVQPFCSNKLTGCFELEKTERPLSRLWFRMGLRPIVLVCFDIFKHHKGSGTVDKIKKYRRDGPSGIFIQLGRG